MIEVSSKYNILKLKITINYTKIIVDKVLPHIVQCTTPRNSKTDLFIS
ncbi:hypothetical protein PUN28_010512 [Cardiocondyla obscurior]|uniref:Uncharacterized protein n=1 Tax=Cardiocondyla obscurior TaxID=286306 RepID=A0AAW2FHP8_9HYME